MPFFKCYVRSVPVAPTAPGKNDNKVNPHVSYEKGAFGVMLFVEKDTDSALSVQNKRRFFIFGHLRRDMKILENEIE